MLCATKASCTIITRVNTFEGGQRGLKPILQQVGISTSILVKMGKDEPVAMDTLAKICVVLDCTLDDIVELGSNTEKGSE